MERLQQDDGSFALIEFNSSNEIVCLISLYHLERSRKWVLHSAQGKNTCEDIPSDLIIGTRLFNQVPKL
jgi:hypothetical protein